MSHERPLGIRSLGEVEDAEILRGAVRRFRRRVLIRSAWILVVVLGVAAIVAGQLREYQRDYRTRIQTGAYWNGAEGTFRVGGTTVGVLKVTVIPGHRLGLELAVYPGKENGECYGIYPPGAFGARGLPTGAAIYAQSFEASSEACGTFTTELLVIPIPTGRTIQMELVHGSHPRVPFTIDLDALKVPSLEGR